MPSAHDTLSRMTERKSRQSLRERAMRPLLELRDRLSQSDTHDADHVLDIVSRSLRDMTTLSPPSKVSKNLQKLKADLDTKIPPKKLGRNVIVATWNIWSLGDVLEQWQSDKQSHVKRDLQSIHCIAEVISHFDVVAIQEVRGLTKGLRYIHEILGPDWGLMVTRESPPPLGNYERFAFLFDMRRVQPSGLASQMVLSEKEIQESGLRRQLARVPFAVGFRSGNKSFTLVTTHIVFRNGRWRRDENTKPERILELETFARYLETWAMKTNVWDSNIIALGDFNVTSAEHPEFKALTSRGLRVHDKILSAPKTVFHRELQARGQPLKQYGLVCWHQGHPNIPDLDFLFNQGGSYIYDDIAMAARKLTKQQMTHHISDHYPVWAEFMTDESGG